ncbi:MAG TPA: hypothetical protein DEP84_21420 [Chloroflexi bacterium]|nr:hypothetical protein [Chloroflexota bacterium]
MVANCVPVESLTREQKAIDNRTSNRRWSAAGDPQSAVAGCSQREGWQLWSKSVKNRQNTDIDYLY